MAKINAHGLRQKGLTYFTERVRPAAWVGDVDTTYYEAWRLRSDGTVQSRIIATWPVGGTRGDAGTTEHRGGAFTNTRRFSPLATPIHLERFLERVGATIVKKG